MPFLDSKRSLALGVFAAIGASICCVGPLLLLALGVGGAWIGNLVALEPYRPLFMGLTLLYFGLAFRRLYSAAAVCVPGASCAKPDVLKRQRLIFWTAVLLVLGLLAAPLAAPILI